MIFHLTTKEQWEAALLEGEYRAASLLNEGFIHFSSYGQIFDVANAYYRSVADPVLIAVDNTKIGGELKWEGESGAEFPHLYRSLNVSEAIAVIPFRRNESEVYVTDGHLRSLAGAVYLESDRLILREFYYGDFSSVHEYAKDAELTRFMPWGPNSDEETRSFLSRKFKEQCAVPRTVYDLAVVEKQSQRLIGSVGLFVRDRKAASAHIGYILNGNFHGKGYASEMSQAILRFGFEALGLNRIEATCDHDNAASFRVMQKIGMQKEGLLRENLFAKGKRRSTIVCAVLKSEFKS